MLGATTPIQYEPTNETTKGEPGHCEYCGSDDLGTLTTSVGSTITICGNCGNAQS